ncbi:RNA signal recognition particle [Candidatus Gottesmanbacteria bacterium RIFCSPHIGHO2_01_FULL_39_10]|uniref:RNA signal recognition particle n=1 Tax=Candidatus Gottesmanbacteria bacterium RIFCSPHIGHO2_01_FULL_39_10 TaxID=1798375 RepID=A0A1F5ZKR4_9BACT|nr:MAG: RNA signal recognition particle [Candidatus Gottesmanbacteria bacterium RIFCSPHIGHO2_01_FULL_39_10]
MEKYVDGFVLVVPKNKVSDYKKMAKEGAHVWMEAGALEYMECMGEDLIPKSMDGMKPLAFTKMAKAKPNETVWFSFVVYKSKKHRDEVNKKVMDEMNKKYKDLKEFSMPFDMKRMAYGGFEVIVEGK